MLQRRSEVARMQRVARKPLRSSPWASLTIREVEPRGSWIPLRSTRATSSRVRAIRGSYGKSARQAWFPNEGMSRESVGPADSASIPLEHAGEYLYPHRDASRR